MMRPLTDRCLQQLVYRAYAIEFALKFLMVAEIFKGLEVAPFTLRIGPFTPLYRA
jgi:hypothetical protein